LHFNLNNFSTKAEVLAAVDRLRYLGQNTNTTGGLKVARLEVFDPSLQRPNVERIIVLITDGVPTYDADKLDDEVAAVKRMGIRIVGLGVTNKVASQWYNMIYTVLYTGVVSGIGVRDGGQGTCPSKFGKNIFPANHVKFGIMLLFRAYIM